MFINHAVANGDNCVRYTEDISAWLTLEKSFVSLATYLYVEHVYAVPLTSVYVSYVVFDRLLDDISSFQNCLDILVCCDYNARTNIIQDYIDEFEQHSHVFLDALAD